MSSRFGRTGRFDLLVLLGDLAVVALELPRLYLRGAAGPLEGARRALPPLRHAEQLDAALSQVADGFGISIAVF